MVGCYVGMIDQLDNLECRAAGAVTGRESPCLKLIG